MKKAILMLLVAICLLPACDSDHPTRVKEIIVKNQEQLAQTVYADDTVIVDGISFTASDAWTAEVTDYALMSESSSKGVMSDKKTPDWITISPNKGNMAGDYTIKIVLEENRIGNDRLADIILMCKKTRVIVAITQKSIAKDGKELALQGTKWSLEGVHEKKDIDGHVIESYKVKYSMFFSDYKTVELIIQSMDYPDMNTTTTGTYNYTAANNKGEITIGLYGHTETNVFKINGNKLIMEDSDRDGIGNMEFTRE